MSDDEGRTRHGTALVTGATSGLGLEFAWQLAGRGHDVVLVARRESLLHEHAERIRDVAGVGAEVLAADLAEPAGRALVMDRLRAEHALGPVYDAPGARTTERPVAGRRPERRPAAIGLLVNNAGFGLGQGMVGADLAKEATGLDVMVRAVLDLSLTAADVMVPRGRGAILNVGSATALTAMGTYASHKAWVRTFTESLASALRGTGVTATVVNPGLVRTAFHTTSGQDAGAYPDAAFLTPEQVVSAALADVARGRVISTPTLMYKAVNAALRLAPRFLVRRVAGAGLSGAAL